MQLDPSAARPDPAGSRPILIVSMCAAIFLLALGIRLLCWQDNAEKLRLNASTFPLMDPQYKLEVERMYDEGGFLFPREHNPRNARMLLHPPGYALLVATISGKEVDERTFAKARYVNVLCDSLSVVIVLLIVMALLPLGVALIAGLLAAVSPHLSYYSLWGGPDPLTVLPILLAVYLIILGTRRPRLMFAVAAGLMVGVACWLRSNALLLAPALALLILVAFNPGRRLRSAFALLVTTLVVVSPITIRNWVVFHKFIPLSLGTGITLVEGIASYDEENRFDMPADHAEVVVKDAEWLGHPEYAKKVWHPDGVERDRERLARGLAVIRSNPLWFLGVMLRRAAFMFSYNDTEQRESPFDSASVNVLAARAPFRKEAAKEAQPVWVSSPAELAAAGTRLSPELEVSLSPRDEALRLAVDGSSLGDQFVSRPISVERNADYLLSLSVTIEQGSAGIKIEDGERRIPLASATAHTSSE
ncbi:MAG TPA: glycosyltransferase family 39 protein, partial [Blastocatellia bacterium]|nr:glycosyltransferase family 39 protein [Blastocatellia bacterium]